MAARLAQQEPQFAAALHRCDDELKELLGWSVWDVTTGRGGPRLCKAMVQPCLFAFAVSLAALWRHFESSPPPSLVTAKERSPRPVSRVSFRYSKLPRLWPSGQSYRKLQGPRCDGARNR